MSRTRTRRRLHRLALVSALALTAVAGPRGEAMVEPVPQLRSIATRSCASPVARGGAFTLTVAGPGSCPACLCANLVFSDGFESGNTSAWTSTNP